MSGKHVRVVAAVIVRQGLVFCARRAPHKSQGGLWEFPGGKVEAEESDEAALAREIQEELRISIDVGPFLGESVFGYAHGVIQLLAYGCEWRMGEPQLLDHDQVRWVRPGELSELAWAPADVPLLEAAERFARGMPNRAP